MTTLVWLTGTDFHAPEFPVQTDGEAVGFGPALRLGEPAAPARTPCCLLLHLRPTQTGPNTQREAHQWTFQPSYSTNEATLKTVTSSRVPDVHGRTCLVCVEHVLLGGKDLTVLLVLHSRALEALRMQQSLDTQLPARLTRRLQWAAGAHLGSGGGNQLEHWNVTCMCDWMTDFKANMKLYLTALLAWLSEVPERMFCSAVTESRLTLDWVFKPADTAELHSVTLNSNMRLRCWNMNNYSQLSSSIQGD